MTESLAAARLIEDGPNALSPPKTVPEWLKFAKQMFTGFAALLWAGAVLCFVSYGIQYAQSANPPKDNVSHPALHCSDLYVSNKSEIIIEYC